MLGARCNIYTQTRENPALTHEEGALRAGARTPCIAAVLAPNRVNIQGAGGGGQARVVCADGRVVPAAAAAKEGHKMMSDGIINSDSPM